MRVVGFIPDPKFTITVFEANEKYLVKFETGPMEQTFKFPKEEVKGIDDIEKLLDGEFRQKTYDIFKDMFLNFDAAKKRKES